MLRTSLEPGYIKMSGVVSQKDDRIGFDRRIEIIYIKSHSSQANDGKALLAHRNNHVRGVPLKIMTYFLLRTE